MHVSANGRGNAWHVANEEAHAHNAPPFELLGYLHSGGFIESVFENWESEFLQMGLFVFLTTYLKQKGSSESKPIDDKDPVEEDPAEKKRDPNAPWPVRRGGIVLALYQRSLFIALLLLFVCSFLLHGLASTTKMRFAMASRPSRGSPQSKPVAASHAQTGGA